MPRFLTPLLVLMLLITSGASSAQQYSSFRFVSDTLPVNGSSVTSIEFFAPDQSNSTPNATLSYLDVAGLSTVYLIEFTPSEIIRSTVPVYMPSADFGITDVSSIDLEEVHFLTGRLIHPDNANATLPPHWFRMTLHEGVWSGVFRIADRIYTIDRLKKETVVEVRTTQSSNTSFQPATQVKLTALIDENYVFSNTDSLGMESGGHIFALESMHVMDGLSADSLGITLKLEQLVYLTAAELATGIEPSSEISNWLEINAAAFGMSDNLATFIFRGADGTKSTTTSVNSKNNFVLQGKSPHYQFDTAHYFGQLLGVPEEHGTLQSIKSSATNPMPAVHWSEAQRAFINNNLLPATLTQTLSYDAPVIEVTEAEAPNVIPDHILDSESPEITSGGGIQDDEPQSNNGDIASGENSATATGGNGGGGALTPLSLLALLFSVRAFRSREYHNR